MKYLYFLNIQHVLPVFGVYFTSPYIHNSRIAYQSLINLISNFISCFYSFCTKHHIKSYEHFSYFDTLQMIFLQFAISMCQYQYHLRNFSKLGMWNYKSSTEKKSSLKSAGKASILLLTSLLLMTSLEEASVWSANKINIQLCSTRHKHNLL